MSKLYLLNAPIIPLPPTLPNEKPATFVVTKITPERAREIVASAEAVVSAIGHQATAKALSALLQREVPCQRIRVFFEENDAAIAFVLRQRLPEGKVIKTTQELNAIGYDLYLIRRVR